ncbi:D-2-hydroxyacid dehydrogenase [Pseudoalteromonas sp. SS15]|uniref:D-2-hydroxyacid dehydrogenase n=1 Tax=Pseudoalteromonas sp. SS15 TaxID=3139393 RepID=UPI003BA8FFAB
MKIALLDAATLANTDLAPLSALGELATYQHTNKEQVLTHCRDADIVISNKVVLDATTLAELPLLKLICVAATGTNNIALDAAKELGIRVCNVAGYSTPSVVQHTFTLLGNLMTNIHRYQQDCANGLWQQSNMFCRLDYSITELSGKNFVIFGHGSLGQAVGKVAEAFGAQVIIAERPNANDIRPGRTAFIEALKMADVLSIHCPLNDETRNLFNSETLGLLKPTSFVINTARGGIVDESALVEILTNNQIAGAGFDVLSVEPAQANNPLANYQGHNLILTPHTAWAAKESIERLVKEIANNIVNFNNGRASNVVV